jgi:hypothetical protein
MISAEKVIDCVRNNLDNMTADERKVYLTSLGFRVNEATPLKTNAIKKKPAKQPSKKMTTLHRAVSLGFAAKFSK